MGTTTNQNGLGYASDDYTCGASGLFWVFYNDGTHWGWKSSSNGQTWSAQSTFTSSVPPPQAGTNDLGFHCTGTAVYYAGGSQNLDTHFYYNAGTLNPDGTITWVGAETAVATLGNRVGYTSITLDSNGRAWVALSSQNIGGGGPYYVEVWELTSGWASSLTLTFASFVPIPQIVPLTSGKMALLYGTGHIAIGTETLTGTTWTAGPSTAATNYFPQFSTAVAIGDTVEYCASDQSHAFYLTFTYGGASWSSPSTTAPASACSATTDGVSVLGLFYVANPTTIRYSQSNDGGSTFAAPVTISNTESSVGWIGAGAVVSTNPPKQAMAVWISGTSSPFDVRFANISTAPVVSEAVTITDANPPAPTGIASVSGCHATVTSIPMDGLPHNFGADPTCSLTITVPTDATYTRYRFPGNSPTWVFSTGSTSPDAHSNTVDYQYSVTASYAFSGGVGTPPPPTFTSKQAGSAYSVALTLSPTVYWLDGSAAWNVTPVLTSGTQTWATTSPTSGVVTGPTILSFAYAPPISSGTGTSTVTSTVTTTTVTTTTTTQTVVSTSTLTTAATTSTVTSTVALATVTSTTTVTTTSGVLVPTSSSLTCDQSRPKVGQHVNCTDIVATADQGIADGSVAWTTSGGGSFSMPVCSPAGDKGQLQCHVQYTPSTSGVQTLTSTYSGDTYHSSSSDSAIVFAGDTSSSRVTSTSLTCDQTYVTIGRSTNCHAIVLTADGGPDTGTVTWTASDGGTFSHVSCNHPDSNGQLKCDAQYTPASMGGQTVTASYSGDGSHTASSDSFQVFVQKNTEGKAVQQAAAAISGGALLGVILAVAVLERKRKG